MRSAGEPSAAITSPGLKWRTSMRSASHANSSSPRSERAGIALSCCARLAAEIGLSISDLRQMRVHELDRDRSLPDPRGHPLDRPMPDIADREDAGGAGFQHVWIAIRRPAVRALPVA